MPDPYTVGLRRCARASDAAAVRAFQAAVIVVIAALLAVILHGGPAGVLSIWTGAAGSVVAVGQYAAAEFAAYLARHDLAREVDRLTRREPAPPA